MFTVLWTCPKVSKISSWCWLGLLGTGRVAGWRLLWLLHFMQLNLPLLSTVNGIYKIPCCMPDTSCWAMPSTSMDSDTTEDRGTLPLFNPLCFPTLHWNTLCKNSQLTRLVPTCNLFSYYTTCPLFIENAPLLFFYSDTEPWRHP